MRKNKAWFVIMLTLMITLGCTIHFSLFTSQGTSCWFQGASAVSSFKFQVKGQKLIFHSSPFTFHLLLNPSKSFANENLRMNEDYYSVGTINMTNLLDAQRLQQQALDQYNDAVCEYQMCRSHYLIVTARSEQSR